MRPDPKVRPKRCAIYTRKSSEEGLEQEFNSLDAQREACEAFIASQKHEGWLALPDRYDDGGISGGTLDRPALQRLIRDIEASLIDVVVVYKIDRLSRALTDFAKLVDTFERHDVTFVAVTQQFNTTTSMGRLTLNILLSFAQFEREVIGERIRDKFAASRKKGMWMGGFVPLGYKVRDRKLVIVKREAALVRRIFDRFAKGASALTVAQELNADGATTKTGKPWVKGAVYKILATPLYVGRVTHKGETYPGEHKAIIDQKTWDRVRAVMGKPTRQRANATRAKVPALLKGLIFGPQGRPMTPTHARKNGKIYRYYVAREVIETDYSACPITTVPAADVEGAVLAQVKRLLTAPEMVAMTWAKAKKEDAGITEQEVIRLLADLDTVWEELFPAEQARIMQLLVERVDVRENGLLVHLRAEGLPSLVAELQEGRRAA
jgi:DNA invertase Pin-like site-specific DNA recombinase